MNHAYLRRLASSICVVLLNGATATVAAPDPRPASADDNWDPRFTVSGLTTLGGAPSGARAVVYLGDNFHVGGTFDTAGRTRAHSIARWDGSRWSALGEGVLTGDPAGSALGLVGTVNALATVGTNVYVGGSFRMAGDKYASGIARWDGVAWHPLGGGNRERRPGQEWPARRGSLARGRGWRPTTWSAAWATPIMTLPRNHWCSRVLL